MAKKQSKKNKKEKLALANLKKRILGIFLIFLSLFLLAAIVFYNPTDNSYNFASNKTTNYLGWLGASSASMMISFLGLFVPLFLVVIMAWGYRLCGLQKIGLISLRIVAWLVGLMSGSLLLNSFANTKVFGGAVGKIISQQITTVLPQNLCWLVGLIAVVVIFVSFNFAIGLSFGFWSRLVANIFVLAYKVVRLVAKSFLFVKNLGSREKANKKTIKSPIAKPIKEPKDKKEKKKQKQKVEDVASKKTAVVEKKNSYKYPDLSLLSRPKEKIGSTISEKELEKISKDLEQVLEEFGVFGKIVKIRPGPVVTLYELEPAPGTKTARVIGLADDIARSMFASSVRIAVVAGSNTIGIEMPNSIREIVWLKDLFVAKEFKDSKNALNVVLGKDIGGENVYADLAKMPHLLVAGTTGSGKSVGMNSMILSLLFKMSPEECKLIMIDPKMLEFSIYNGIPHLLTPVITEPSKAVLGLKWAVKEMEDRYKAMAMLNVRNISGYNTKLKELREKGERIVRNVQTGFDMDTGAPIFEEQEMNLDALPYIVVVVDEMADLMLVAGKEVEAAIQRLAQMARAAGIHLILATQRPSVNVITGVIKANFPTRISFQVTSIYDSKTILGEPGAEQLLGMGDMLYMPSGLRPVRVHGSFVKDAEVEKIVEFLKSQKEPEYVEAITQGELNIKDSGPLFDKTGMGAGSNSDDDLYNQAVEIVRRDKKTSISYIQRRLRIGYNRAASIVDKLEETGVLSAPDHSGKREILE